MKIWHPAANDESVRLDQAVDELRIFVGFGEVSSLLLHRQGDFGQEERLADKLSKRSAVLGHDQKSLNRDFSLGAPPRALMENLG